MLRKIFGGILPAFLILALANGATLRAQTRISFKRGKSSATVSGKLAADSSRVYTIGAREGQILRLAAKGDVGYEILGDDYHSSVGNADFSEYTLLKNGDYQIKIQSGDKGGAFRLTVTIY